VNDLLVIPSASARIAEGILSRRLVEADTPREFREIAEVAEVAQGWAKRARLAYQRQHKFGCIRLEALRRLAIALAQMPRLKGRPKSIPGRNTFLTAREILGTKTAGQARKLAHLARKVLGVREAIYRRYLGEAERHEWTVSPDGLLAFANPIERSQHFTDPALAQRLYKLTLDTLAEHGISIDVWVERAAGDGSFYDLLPSDRRLGIDIDPQRAEFIAADFLDFDGFEPGVRYGAIGNPPWRGAVKIFNKCAAHCAVIAFLLPGSFYRERVAKQRDRRMRLLHREELQNVNFCYRHQDAVFASLFEIWVRDDVEHHPPEPPPVRSHQHFQFLPSDSDYRTADIVIRRVGTDAGRILGPDEVPVKGNCYLIRVSPELDLSHVRARLAAISWDDPRYLNTAAGHAERGYKVISMGLSSPNMTGSPIYDRPPLGGPV
jgi:hypothetical protein